MDTEKLIGNVRQHPVVWAIIITCIIPFAVLQLKGVNSISTWFMPNSIGELTTSLEWWRIISPIFIHYTIIHLFVNVYLWWLLGCMMEDSSRRLLLVILIGSAVITNICQYLISGPKFGGLSGVVYTQFGFIWLIARLQPERGLKIDLALSIALMAVLLIAATGWVGLYSNAAHISGLLLGLISAGIFHSITRSSRQ